MARHIFVVESCARDGCELAYNEWYDNIHVKDMLKVPGVIAAERFAFQSAFKGEPPRNRHLCIYELETDDPEETMASLTRALPEMYVSDALNLEATTAMIYRSTLARRSKA